MQSLCPDISEAMFYWFTDPVVGPGFSEQFIGFVTGIAYVAMVGGVGLYNCWFRFYTIRNMFFWPQVFVFNKLFLKKTDKNSSIYMPFMLYTYLDIYRFTYDAWWKKYTEFFHLLLVMILLCVQMQSSRSVRKKTVTDINTHLYSHMHVMKKFRLL